MSDSKFVDLADIIEVRFGCKRCSYQDRLPRDHVAMAAAIGKLVANHVHRDGESIGTAEKDNQDLNTALYRLLTVDLPRISEIISRRKLTVEFEIKRSESAMQEN